MDSDLKFRYQKHDGRNTAIIAVAAVACIPVLAFAGPFAVMGIAGITVGVLLARAL